MNYSPVLKTQKQVDEAADWLKKEFNYRHADPPKAWDLAQMLQFIQANVSKEGNIMDLGAVGCPVTILLSKKGYSNLSAIDLSNKLLHKIPFWLSRIRYAKGDLHETGFEEGSFDCLTCVSVIEHGVDLKRFGKEAARILKNDGYLLVSFDYWPQKIKTDGVQFFGLPWTIFSKTETSRMIKEFEKNGLKLVGKPSFSAKEKLVHWLERDYTFGLMVFQKKSKAKKKKR